MNIFHHKFTHFRRQCSLIGKKNLNLRMEEPLIYLKSDCLRYIGVSINNPRHINIEAGVTVIIGPNGSGKSTLGRIIEKGWNIATNSISSPRGKLKTKLIEFNDIHSLTGAKAEYYQQRHEATMNDEVPTVSDVFADKINTPEWKELCAQLRLDGIEDKKLNFLSSGELRKLLIINILLDTPDLLILDNPYIGLDAASRKLLDEMLDTISARGISIILLLCNPGEIPTFTSSIIPIRNLTIEQPIKNTPDDDAMRASLMSLMDFAVNLDAIPLPWEKPIEHDITLNMNKCNVRYGDKQIIKDESWTVKNGECWALAGPNGSGKSVLLSLVSADNPQAYSNDITIFDRRRGSGESIWDIKKHIGYVSPEMHLYFKFNGTVTDVIAQGLRDTVGNYGSVSAFARERAEAWIKLLHLEELADRRYNTLSAGEQRLVLIARTLIKHPALLIMDEPLHGLDAARKRSVRAILNKLVSRDKPSLIYVTHFLPEVPECITKTKTLQKLKNV